MILNFIYEHPYATTAILLTGITLTWYYWPVICAATAPLVSKINIPEQVPVPPHVYFDALIDDYSTRYNIVSTNLTYLINSGITAETHLTATTYLCEMIFIAHKTYNISAICLENRVAAEVLMANMNDVIFEIMFIL